jgi:integrase
MAEAPDDKPASQASTCLTVAVVSEKYLDWCEKHRAGRTYEWYHDHIQSFIDSLTKPDEMPVALLKPFHVVEWLDKHPAWGDTYRRGAIVAIQRPFNWAEEMGYVDANPIKRIKKPKPKRRDSHVTPADFVVIRSRYSEGDPFLDILDFAWHSGCRPQEARHIEARHVKLADERIDIPPEEAKGKERWRTIYLNATALGIINRLMALYPKGKLFRNEDGMPWKRFALCNRFDRLQVFLGMQALKQAGIATPEPLPRFNPRTFTDKKQMKVAWAEHQKKLLARRQEIVRLARAQRVGFSCYDLRHGFATRMLVNGVDHVTVGTLMGHSDGTQVARTYQHIDKQHGYLKKVLEAHG